MVNKKPKIDKPRKLIKCFCNDERQCGSAESQQYQASNLNISDSSTLVDTQNDSDYVQKFLANKPNLNLRSCLTDTVCLTKKIQKRTGETYLKYSCDYSTKNGLRDEVIGYRDCKVNTQNYLDKTHVLSTSAEYCCDDKYYCNIDLNPTLSVRDFNDFISNAANNEQPTQTTQTILDPVNLVLSCFSIAVFLIALVLFIFYLYKKFRIESAKNKFIKSQIYKASINTENTSPSSNNSPSNLLSNKPLLSPHSSSQSTTSTTITSVNSKENSINLLKAQLYPDTQNQLIEQYEPFLANEISQAIKINSPFSTTPSSAICNTYSTAQSPSELEWSGSGSGAGFPQCVQRTIARQIKLIYPCIGKGRFGEVYKGEWRGEFVAVKTFNSADEKSWENECNIYNTTGFRHENILGFIAADNIDRGLYTELWLITEFHENGSLFDYLSVNQINPDLALKMALSIVNGMVHLHMPIESCKGKPALAHCDLKSKNILVKTDLSCCIGDLGLALSGDKDGKVLQQGNIRTGTKRYMAPEILNKKIDCRYLDNFQKAEMYSLALVFWELLRSCKFEDDESKVAYSFEYKMPFFEYIQGDPDEALMCKIVCEQKLRPSVSNLWKQNKIMNQLMRLTEELWVENPNERLNALRLKKSLTKLKIDLVDRKTLPAIIS